MAWLMFLAMSSRARYRHPRDRWLVHPRAAHHHQGPRRPEPHRRRRRRGCRESPVCIRVPPTYRVTNAWEQPAYDTNAEHTTMAAADALYEIMSIMVKKGPLSATVDQEVETEL